MRINNRIPITLRITGVLTEDQLAAVNRVLTRTLTARLGEAERTLAIRYPLARTDPYTDGAVAASGLPASASPPEADQGLVDDVAPGDPGAADVAAVADAPREYALDEGDDASGAGTAPALPADAAPDAPLAPEGDPGVRAAAARSEARRARRQQGRVAFIKAAGPDRTPVRDQFLEELLREARRNPQPSPPEPVRPGDRGQQRRTVIDIDPIELWQLPRIQDAMRRLAERAADWHRSHRVGGVVKADPDYWLDRWRIRFAQSVNYILTVRATRSYQRRSVSVREFYLAKLRDAENALVKSAPPDLAARIEELRRTIHDEWMRDVDTAANQFVVLAENEVGFFTEDKPVRIYGLPELVEGIVATSDFPQLFEKDSKPGFSPAVARLMAAVQKAWGRHVVAGNYPGHEQANPYVGNIESIGKYSFDVHLPVPISGDGFYEHDATVGFFKAVEEAARATDIEWIALYNDARVANEVNKALNVRRIYFSGGGGPRTAAPNQEGSFHHGPAPFILHIHFNIMPKNLVRAFLRAHGFKSLPFIDLGDSE